MIIKEQQKINRDIWYEALLSGKYKQCRYSLHNTTDGHCCLGVADLLFDNDERYYRIIKQLAISDFKKITKLNDDLKMSFDEIANLLKNNEAEYFDL